MNWTALRSPLRIFQSIKFRLVSLSIVISGLTLALLSAALYQGIKQTQTAAFDSSLHNHAVDIANATDLNVLGDLIVRRDALIDERKIFPFPLGQSVVQIRTLDGAVIMSTVRLSALKLPLSPATAEETVRFGSRLETIWVGRVPYRLIDFLTNRPSLPPLILQVAVPLTMIENERSQILSLLFIAIPLALLAAAMGGVVLASRALNPVNRIIRSARAIQPHELYARVPVPRETEMKRLALTLNDLLARLQLAFASQEQFIADASHQLKTPLAIMRGEIDVFTHRLPSPPESMMPQSESRGLIQSVSQEIDHLSKMVDDLLMLARFDSGSFTPQFERVRIDELIFEAISQLRKLAREKGVELRFDIRPQGDEAPDLEVRGDADLLKAVFFNLIENAIKYAPSPSLATIEITTLEREIEVRVSDQGPGISPDDLPRIFDRFYRGGLSQHRVSGVGLGLSIASRIAKFHGATLTAAAQPAPGATFVFRIKKF